MLTNIRLLPIYEFTLVRFDCSSTKFLKCKIRSLILTFKWHHLYHPYNVHYPTGDLFGQKWDFRKYEMFTNIRFLTIHKFTLVRFDCSSTKFIKCKIRGWILSFNWHHLQGFLSRFTILMMFTIQQVIYLDISKTSGSMKCLLISGCLRSTSLL